VTPLVPAGDTALAAVTCVVSVGAAGVYLFVGRRIAERQVSSPARLASFQLALWWGGLGVTVAISALELVLALANAFPFALALTLALVSDLVAVALLWGLAGFLVYVYTGRHHLVALTALYGAFYVMLLYYVLDRVPHAVAFQAGAPTIVYSQPGPWWLVLPIVLILLVPEIVGGVLYLSLLRRTRDRGTRSRIWLVGGGILLWFAIALLVPSSAGSWALLRSVLEVVPGLMSLIAFYPPAWAQRRFGLASAVPRTDPGISEASIDP
jgi:hypothetical protein